MLYLLTSVMNFAPFMHLVSIFEEVQVNAVMDLTPLFVSQSLLDVTTDSYLISVVAVDTVINIPKNKDDIAITSSIIQPYQ